MKRSNQRAMRREFASGLLFGLRVIWPVLSALLAMIVVLGLLAGFIEGWPVSDSIYFAFVSGLTIGYGDLAPKTLTARVLAIVIGVCGVLLTGLVAAIAVKALSAVSGGDHRE
jgi:CBS domain containing-hemolysin-like protein